MGRLTSLTVFVTMLLVGTVAGAQENRPWLTPHFGGIPLDADLADAITASEKDDLLVWGQCETLLGAPIPECLLLAVEAGGGFEVITVQSTACSGGDESCYGGYSRIADVTVGEDDRKRLEALLDVEGGLGGTPLGMVPGTGCGTTPELRVRVHGGIATSPLGVTPDIGALPELRVRVHGGLATSPLGVDVPDAEQCVTVESGLGTCPLGMCTYPTECLVAELVSMMMAVLE